MSQPDFDLQSAHRYFSAHCFNLAWDLIDLPTRTPEQQREMLQLTLVSLWHWQQRTDCTPTNLSVAYWQAARVYALLGKAEEARQYGQLCLTASLTEGVEPFYLGYAYEALARAEAMAGNPTERDQYLHQARLIIDLISDAESRALLLADVETII